MKYLIVCNVDCNDGDTVSVVTTVHDDKYKEVKDLADIILSSTKNFCFEDDQLPDYLQGILTDKQIDLLHELIHVTWELSNGYYALESMKAYKIDEFEEDLV